MRARPFPIHYFLLAFLSGNLTLSLFLTLCVLTRGFAVTPLKMHTMCMLPQHRRHQSHSRVSSWRTSRISEHLVNTRRHTQTYTHTRSVRDSHTKKTQTNTQPHGQFTEGFLFVSVFAGAFRRFSLLCCVCVLCVRAAVRMCVYVLFSCCARQCFPFRHHRGVFASTRASRT